jgi:hypothetical protein
MQHTRSLRTYAYILQWQGCNLPRYLGCLIVIIHVTDLHMSLAYEEVTDMRRLNEPADLWDDIIEKEYDPVADLYMQHMEDARMI